MSPWKQRFKMKQENGKNINLTKLYTTPSRPGAFAGQAAFIKSLKHKKINKQEIKDFLSSIDAYTLHVPKKKVFLKKSCCPRNESYMAS